ncbi:MAG: hypothetical protein IJ466_11925 [Clostridia bacterium]|nr:hypothetical protein [Clostridia bacterium]
MTEIFESIMLICFGLSWPMSVVKNIKAHTAKSMSLPFILLIITGYIAGIAAKLISHNYSYVLAIYAINLCFVSANLVVYFINRSYDLHGGDWHHRRMHHGAHHA